MKKLLPIILILVACAGGFFGGHMLKPVEEPEEGQEEMETAEASHREEMSDSNIEYVKFSRQFIVPILEGTKVRSLIVADIQLEVSPGSSEQAFSREPKIRDSFLKVLYRHSHTGMLKKSMVSDRVLKELRDDLLTAAQSILGDSVLDVLITDLLRQDQ